MADDELKTFGSNDENVVADNKANMVNLTPVMEALFGVGEIDSPEKYDDFLAKLKTLDPEMEIDLEELANVQEELNKQLSEDQNTAQ